MLRRYKYAVHTPAHTPDLIRAPRAACRRAELDELHHLVLDECISFTLNARACCDLSPPAGLSDICRPLRDRSDREREAAV